MSHLSLKIGSIENFKQKVSSYEGEAVRGIDKVRRTSTGELVEQTQDQVFDFHIGTKLADGRYSIGGPKGDSAVYTSIGYNALETVLAETDKPLNKLLVGTKQVKLDRVLDLTDPHNLKVLGIDEAALKLDKATNQQAYELTQMLGNLAQKHGFQAIKVPSQPSKKGINLILFK